MSKRDIAQEITDQILNEIETGVMPWTKPWTTAGLPRNAESLRHYRGVNMLVAGILGELRGYETPCYLTFNQVKKLGGAVKAGSKGLPIIHYSTFEVEDKSDPDKTKHIPILKHFTVFNLDQTEGLEALIKLAKPETFKHESIDSIDSLIPKIGAKIEVQGESACFVPGQDLIRLPKLERFKTREEYYSTLFHELIHWTGHADRLDRKLKTKTDKQDYAFEELVAELGAAFLCAHFRLPYQSQHASYIKNWSELLRDDKRAILRASARARDASEYLLKQMGLLAESQSDTE